MIIDCKIKRMVIKALILWVIVALAGLVFGNREIYIGFTLGGIIAIADFIMIAIDVPAVMKTGGKASKEAFIRFARRYLVIGAVLMLAINFGFRNFIGLCVGLVIVRVIIFSDSVILSYFNEIKNQIKKYMGKEG